MSSQPTIFISYSRKDEAEKVALLTHLNILNRDGQFDLWSDDRIEAGETKKLQIAEAMNRAKVAILLISANFLSSEFILDQEVNTLLQRSRREGLIIFPVIAKDCAWDRIDWLNRMEIRPRDGRPIWGDGGSHVDADLAAIAREVAIIIERSRDGPTESPPPTTPPPTLPSTPPSPPTDFNLGELRRRLDQKFGDAELIIFCQIYFLKVYDKFAEGMRKDVKITMLLDYARRTPERQARLLSALDEYEE